MTIRELSAQRLRELLHYDVETGIFRRRTSGRGYVAWSIAGSESALGYIEIGLDKGRFLAHRLAWLYVHGSWPCGQIDHINRNKSDNRIVNLRDVSRSINAENLSIIRPSNKSSGLLGVSFSKTARKWQASIKSDGKQRYLGLYDSPAEAQAAYLSAKHDLHKGYAP